MKKAQYGLTEAGFVIKPLSVILEEEKDAFKESFGDDVDLSGESVAGAYIGNQTAKISALWEQLEGLWNAGDKDSASGVFLDRLAAFVNVEREKGESDTELRASMTNKQKQATCTEPAIENAISKLTGVSYAKVYSNRDISPFGSRPAKSYEAVVVGGDSQEIAETIFKNGPAGIQAYGNTVMSVKDSQGFDWEIGFSRPLQKYVWIEIALTLYDEEEFPQGAVQGIKNNIVEWGAENLGVNVDLIFQRLNIPIYKVPGIASAEIKVATTLDASTPPEESDYKAENIEIGEVEIAVIDESRISISVE